MRSAQIYIACHNQTKLPVNNELYIPLQVGKQYTKEVTSYVSDDTGEHISLKNPYYSELTGWYWIWKNQKHDIIGTSHYRRYFTTRKLSAGRKASFATRWLVGIYKKHYGLIYTNNTKKWKKYILNSTEINALLNEYDMILPVSKIFKYSVKEQYIKRHRASDVALIRKLIEKKHPDYLNSFDAVFRGNRLYSFNMMVTRWSVFNDYMQWLFPLLFELERQSDFPKDDPYQKRLCAFMAERLQTVWIQQNNLQVKELQVIYFKKSKITHF